MSSAHRGEEAKETRQKTKKSQRKKTKKHRDAYLLFVYARVNATTFCLYSFCIWYVCVSMCVCVCVDAVCFIEQIVSGICLCALCAS